jgi:hypothetical protein
LRIGLIVTMGALAFPGVASADAVSDYHPTQTARNFVTGPGGWEGTTTSEGICLQDLTCPTVTNTWVSSGGTAGDGDGFLRTEIENTAGAESTSRGVWRSPVFDYQGADGKKPTEVSFELARRSDLSPLLATSGSSANYTVEIVEAGTGVGRTVVDTAPLGAIEGWARTPQVTVKPSSLVMGGRYRLRITSTFSTEAEAFPASFVDYDDVRLRAIRDDAAAGGGGGNGGATGGGGNGSGNGGAVLRGNRLFLKLQCLGVARHGKCKVRAVAYSQRGKKGARMTFPIERKVKAKKGKKVTLRVRPRFVKELSKRKKVLVRSQIKAGDERKTKYRRYKLTEAR